MSIGIQIKSINAYHAFSSTSETLPFWSFCSSNLRSKGKVRHGWQSSTNAKPMAMTSNNIQSAHWKTPTMICTKKLAIKLQRTIHRTQKTSNSILVIFLACNWGCLWNTTDMHFGWISGIKNLCSVVSFAAICWTSWNELSIKGCETHRKCPQMSTGFCPWTCVSWVFWLTTVSDSPHWPANPQDFEFNSLFGKQLVDRCCLQGWLAQTCRCVSRIWPWITKDWQLRCRGLASLVFPMDVSDQSWELARQHLIWLGHRRSHPKGFDRG